VTFEFGLTKFWGPERVYFVDNRRWRKGEDGKERQSVY